MLTKAVDDIFAFVSELARSLLGFAGRFSLLQNESWGLSSA